MEALTQVEAAVDALAAVDVAELDPAVLGEFVVGLHELSDRLSGVRRRAVVVQGRTAAWQGQAPGRTSSGWRITAVGCGPGDPGGVGCAAAGAGGA